MKKSLGLAMVALFILFAGCANLSVKEIEKAELKILEAQIEPVPPKLEKGVYLALKFKAPAGSVLNACVKIEVLVPKQMAGPYSTERSFEQELIGTGETSEIKIPLGKFHSNMGNLPVRVDVYLKDKDGRGQIKRIDFSVLDVPE